MRTLLLMLAFLAPCLAQAQLSVSNVRAAQRPGSNLVDIYYDLGGQALSAWVSVEISSDGGTTHTVPAANVTGHVGGARVQPGSNRKITWNAGTDWSEQFSSAMRVKISAMKAAPMAPMALIHAGSFQMGDDNGQYDEAPAHVVHVNAFYMDKYEVTKELWDEVANWAQANGYGIRAEWGPGKAANHPVHIVDWHVAVIWCNARSVMENLTPCYTVDGAVMKNADATPDCDFSANGYRLPTEAEWEKAARGGLANKRFPWGDTITHDHANYSAKFLHFYGDYDVSPTPGYHPTYATEPRPYSSPVGSFAPNSYGLYDMTGNVSEWCWYYYAYYRYSPASDPQGPKSGYVRVSRGGAWDQPAEECRIARRKTASVAYGGFRCARRFVP